MNALNGNSKSKKLKKTLCVMLTCLFVAMFGMFVVSCGGNNETPPSACAHEYVVEKIVTPTCEAGGYTVYKCSKCGETKQDDITEKTTHSFKNGECEFCHIKEAELENAFYEAMFNSIATAKSVTLEIPEGVVLSLVNYYLVKNGETIYDEDFLSETMSFDETEGVIYIDENGNLGFEAHIATSRSEYDGNFGFTTIDVVLSDGYIYIKNSARTGNYSGDVADGGTFARVEVKDIAGADSAIPAEAGAYIAKALETMPKITAKIDEYAAKVEKYGAEVVKLFIDMLFDGVETSDGVTYTLNLQRLNKYVDYLADTKTSEIINAIFGKKATLNLSTFVMASLEKTIPAVLEDLKEYGFNYEEILTELDKIALGVTGEEKFVTNYVKKFIESCGEKTVKAIVAEAAELSEADVTSIVKTVIDDIKNLSPVEILIKYVTNGNMTKEKLIGEVKSTIESASKALEGQNISFKTDKDGKVLSFDVDLINLINGKDDHSKDDGGNSDYYTKYNLKVRLTLNEKKTIEACEGLKEEYEANKLVTTPSRKISVKAGDTNLVVVIDERGEICGVEYAEGEAKASEYTLKYQGLPMVGDYFCAPWKPYVIVYKETDSFGNAETGNLEVGYNTETKEVIIFTDDEAEYAKMHDFKISVARSSNVCGGEIVQICTKCNAEKVSAIKHTGDKVESYKLAFEGGNCTDGVIKTVKCTDCDEVIYTTFDGFGNHAFNKSETEYIRFDGCENMTVEHRICLCGQSVYAIVEGERADGDVIEGDDVATEEQLQVDGWFDPLGGIEFHEYDLSINRERTYTCYDCGFTVVRKPYWKKVGNCTAELHDVWGYKNGEEFVLVEDYFLTAHVYHDYETTISETEIGSETKSVCKDCGSSAIETLITYTDEYGIWHNDRTLIAINKLNDGNKSYEWKSERKDGDNYFYFAETEKIVTAEGVVLTTESGKLYEAYDDIPEGFENGRRQVEWENGERTEKIDGVKIGTDETFYFMEYYEHADGSWEKTEWSYDFENGLKITEKTTGSDGYEETITY